jgi:gamma-glutamyltranspeptidase / glutathione hydrolase / leukotriene-C4 hydrolase
VSDANCHSFLVVELAVRGNISFGILKWIERYNEGKTDNQGHVIESELGVVAADDARCSVVGVSMLGLGGHVVDAAVAAALCASVVFQASRGIGGGSFMVGNLHLAPKHKLLT